MNLSTCYLKLEGKHEQTARVTIPQALAYRGGQPMTAWLLHRITGIGIVLFVSMHVFAGFILYAIPGGTANSRSPMH